MPVMTATRRHTPIAVALLALLLASPAVAQQQIPISDKITGLDGTWVRAPEKGWGGICGVPASNGMEVRVSATEIAIRRDTFLFGVSSHTLQPLGVFRLDGSETVLADGRTATASHDAGWLAVTMTRQRPGASTLVMREVYILNKNRDELTVWRTLNGIFPDGSQGKIDCGNHHAIVYSRK
jgi:hypothetical protein